MNPKQDWIIVTLESTEVFTLLDMMRILKEKRDAMTPEERAQYENTEIAKEFGNNIENIVKHFESLDLNVAACEIKMQKEEILVLITGIIILTHYADEEELPELKSAHRKITQALSGQIHPLLGRVMSRIIDAC